MKNIREFLKMPAAPETMNNPVAALLREHGREFNGVKFPEHMEKGPMKNCFENAMNLCAKHPELKFAEGYAVAKKLGIPLEHGWCVDEDGTAFDPTWDEPETTKYFGVSLPLMKAGAIHCELGYYGILGNLWRALDPDGILALIRAHNEIEETTERELAA